MSKHYNKWWFFLDWGLTVLFWLSVLGIVLTLIGLVGSIATNGDPR